MQERDRKDEIFMQRALQLAALGFGKTKSNPMVGCVIVWKDKILGEGYHTGYGKPHAEVEAIQSVRDKSLLPESTIYVTLEPCNHFGKTPPCADLIVRTKPKRLVVAMEDPNPETAGKGLQRIREGGIETHVGVLRKDAEALNPAFVYWHTRKRPYVVLKWAETQDGYVARENFDSKWISNPLSRQIVHKMRAGLEGILVGYRTALHDNPNLLNRDWPGEPPLRIFLDREGTLTSGDLVSGSSPTLCLTQSALKSDLYDTQRVPSFEPEEILKVLTQKNVQSVLVEGGASTLELFIKAGLWNEAWVFQGEATFGNGIAAPVLDRLPERVEQVMDTKLFIYRNI